MTRSMAIVLASVASGFAALAQAQSQTAYGPDNGFFRPSPDVSLTAPRTPNGSTAQPAQQPFLTITSPQSTPMPTQAVAVPATVSVVPSPALNRGMNAAAATASVPAAAAVVPAVSPGNAATSAAPAVMPPAMPNQAAIERQMDRSENEVDRARAQMMATPPGVGAAFDGTTSSENR